MKSGLSTPHIFHIVITLLLSLAAMILILSSNQIIAAINPSALNGVETRFQLDSEAFQLNETSTRPLLITGLFSSCQTTCPANISLLRQLKATDRAEFDYLFINLRPDENAAELLNAYLSGFAPDMQLLLPQDKEELVQLMKVLPENFSLQTTSVHHSGNIYLHHPNGKGLITYRQPDVQHIINDLLTLQQRGN